MDTHLNLASVLISKKPSKAEGLEIVKSLEAIGKVAGLNHAETQHALAQLYQFFMPVTPTKPKTAQDWVGKAMPKNHKRPALLSLLPLLYMYSNGSSFVATDGNRLHMVHNQNVPQGSYDRAMGLVDRSVCGEFPNWRRVIPDHHNHIGFKQLTLEERQFKKVNVYDIYYQGDLLVTVDSSFMRDALSFMDSPIVSFGDNRQAILLTDGDKQAVIMPVYLAHRDKK